jgi:tRNA(adenine34) deaminase
MALMHARIKRVVFAALKAFFAEPRAQIKALRDARQAASGRQALQTGLDVLEPAAESPQMSGVEVIEWPQDGAPPPTFEVPKA